LVKIDGDRAYTLVTDTSDFVIGQRLDRRFPGHSVGLQASFFYQLLEATTEEAPPTSLRLISWENVRLYTLSEAWSGVNRADIMAAQGAFGADFYDRSTRKIVGTMLWTEYRPVIKFGPKGALGSHEIRSKPRERV